MRWDDTRWVKWKPVKTSTRVTRVGELTSPIPDSLPTTPAFVTPLGGKNLIFRRVLMSDSYLDEIASIRQKLLKRWADTQAQWTDKRARKFDYTYRRPIENTSKDMLNAARDLARTLREARAACK